MANSYNSRATSSGYKHSGLRGGAPRVGANMAPGGGKTGISAAKGGNKDRGVEKAAGGSSPKGMKSYKEGKGV